MKRALLLIIGIIGILIALAMWWSKEAAVTGLIVALAAALPKLIDKSN
jgi:uncharacterized membrane-anchored protein